MTFEEAWEAFSLGDVVKVSNGLPPPSTNTEGIPYKAWMSHNFTGTLVAKNDSEYRSMQFDKPPCPIGNVVGYIIQEGIGHAFTAA